MVNMMGYYKMMMIIIIIIIIIVIVIIIIIIIIIYFIWHSVYTDIVFSRALYRGIIFVIKL